MLLTPLPLKVHRPRSHLLRPGADLKHPPCVLSPGWPCPKGAAEAHRQPPHQLLHIPILLDLTPTQTAAPGLLCPSGYLELTWELTSPL